jgi:hypothetical protein
MPLQQIVPTWLALNNGNDTSPSYFTDLRTGQPVMAGGLNQGDYFDVTNEEANQLSYTTNGVLYEGRYRRVKVDSGATASNVKAGTIGLMPSTAATGLAPSGQRNPAVNVVTSYDQAIGSVGGVRPVVFLNTVTPGNYCFVQELGTATVLGGATLQKATPAIGDLIEVTTLGVAQDPTTQTMGPLFIGKAVTLPAAAAKFIVLLDLPVVQG